MIDTSFNMTTNINNSVVLNQVEFKKEPLAVVKPVEPVHNVSIQSKPIMVQAFFRRDKNRISIIV